MRRVPALIAAAAFAVPTVLALSAAPSSAGYTSAVVVSGTAHCDIATGHETYQLDWSLLSYVNPDVTITSAVESGAFDGTVDFTPNPIPNQGTATGSDGPVPNVVGTVTLTIDWTFTVGTEPPTDGTSVGTIHLDGNCKLPPVTSVAPTTTAERAAVVVRPHFTG